MPPPARRIALALAAAVILTGAPAPAAERPPPVTAPAVADHSHDFDFEFGDWRAHIARRLRPLTGSTDWVEYDGDSIVRPVWSGKANLGELNVEGPAGRIQGLSLRTYDPATGQWSIRWANAADGDLGQPMIGAFSNGRGLFYDRETLAGRAILVRFIFSDVGAKSFHLEQAFSADGGVTWEVNWIADFERRTV
ncbi:hypothetical protein [Caulobacter ginsengisoli]|nr:hypothetical protein [Caulobacter ginsengisoli]